MRTILNILNFILGGFATTLGWLLATLVSIVLVVTLPLTRSCWEITRLSLFPYGNEAIHVDELEPGRKNGLLNAGGTVLTLSLTYPVWVRAYVDEKNLGQAQPGQAVLLYTDSRPDKPYHGKIGFVSPSAEFTPKTVETPDLRTDLVYRLRIVVNDADGALRQGMPVTVSFNHGNGHE